MKFKSLIKIFGKMFIACAVLAIPAVSYFRLLDNFELETLDLRFSLRPKIQATDKVVIVEIGDDSIKKVGSFPFDRSYYAIVTKALASFGAKAIVFDLFFSEHKDHDMDFEDAAREAGNVYFPYVFDMDRERLEVPTAHGYLSKSLDNFTVLAKGTGHINAPPDSDGKFRRVPLYVKYNNAFYPYLSLSVVRDYLGIRDEDIKLLPGKYLLFGRNIKIPLDSNSNMIINFSGRWGDVFKHVSFVDIAQTYFAGFTGQKPVLNPNFFKGKICIIGLTATGTTDLHPNPLEPLYPAVGIHAELFNSITSGRFVSRASKEANLAILLFLCALIWVCTVRTRPLKGLFILISAILLFLMSGVLVFNIYGLWIDVFYPVVVISVLYLSLTLYRYLAEWKKRLLIEGELEIARKIQHSFLPKKLPEIAGLEVSAGMFTARQVGGDLYDFEEFPDGRLGVMIGDVSGKGVPASLFMAMVAGSFKFFATQEKEPKTVLASLNDKLVKESSSNLFVTMFYLIFDVKNLKASYANGGHLPTAYLGAKKDRVVFLDVSDGAPLGLMEGVYSGGTADFAKGDIFVFYTDGVTEAMNARMEMYGRERMSAVIESHRDLPASELLKVIEKDIRKFEPRSRQHDDMTLVVTKVL